MKVDVQRVPCVSFADLEYGDVFEHDGEHYIKVKWEMDLAVRLVDGHARHDFLEWSGVIPCPRANLRIEVGA